jgi:predicted RecB family endonuclease/outer membrane protein OmpA-like peptidoglycan-associated protein
MGLKVFSEQFRDDVLRLNLQTPPEIVVGLVGLSSRKRFSAYANALGKDGVINWGKVNVKNPGDIDTFGDKERKEILAKKLATPLDVQAGIKNTVGAGTLQSYLNSLGKEGAINWRGYNTNPGDVDTVGDDVRKNLLLKNRPENPVDPSESSQTVNDIKSYKDSIGKPGVINDFTVPNQKSVSHESNQTAEVTGRLNTQMNPYVPTNYETYETTINRLKTIISNSPYISESTLKINGGINPQEYQYSDFLDINNRNINVFDVLNNQERILQTDTLLMNIAALQLKSTLETRIRQNLEKETLGRVNLIDALTNPSTAINILKDPKNNLFERDYRISKPANYITKVAEFIGNITGVESPVSLLQDYDEVKIPSCFCSGTDENDNTGLRNRSLRIRRNAYILDRTGGGQRTELFAAIKMNKYQPDYVPEYETKFGQSLREFKESVNNVTGFLGLGSGRRPRGNFYIGKPDFATDPVSIMQGDCGDQIRSNEELTKDFADIPAAAGILDKGESKVGLGREEDLTWINGDEEELLTLEVNPFKTRTFSTNYQNTFRECSLMDKTQSLLKKGGINQAISQVRDRFKDGDYVYSKGNATKKIQVSEFDEVTRRKNYEVTDEYCRVWTKVNGYEEIRHLVRFRDLIRREKNSVIDNYANYNIFPSELNVNTGLYGTLTDVNSRDSVQDEYKIPKDERARKYMFSIENLAWKDSDMMTKKDGLFPNFEKGPNGGRIMWFPPYDISFTENTVANWTTHQFIGRPEPIYTYNNAERIGTLSWTIVVDHPTILNVIVKKELANLPDETVDQILDAFWAGCLNYDIFELARIYDQLSNTEIQYFKDLIAGLKTEKPNEVVNSNNKEQELLEVSEIENTDTSLELVVENLKNLKLFFENDIPGTNDINSYDTLLEDYRLIIFGKPGAAKLSTTNPEVVLDYSKTIGINSENKSMTPAYDKDIITELDSLNTNIKKIKELAKNKEITIKLKAYASALNNPTANKALAERRFYSIANYIVKLFDNTYSEFKKTNTIEYTPQDGSYRLKIVLEKDFGELKVRDMLEPFNVTDSYVQSYDEGSDLQKITCATKTFEGRKSFEELVASVMSAPACYARRVEVSDVKVIKLDTVGEANEDKVTEEKAKKVDIKDTSDEKELIVTKREIAQRLLNRLLTEQDYFEYIKERDPIIYNSLKEKLKFFSPAFHAMTPEGLNSRLTFLQQCLRPGETIDTKDVKKDEIIKTDAANNTTFGRPPICILRIGDFYHGKIVINNLNISFEPLLLDLNPEGIGVQPMYAKVDLQFKYIGGHGLREPVNKLQNALSFNYYANTDIYDYRSYANQTNEERELINLESNFNYETGEYDSLDLEALDFDYYERIEPYIPPKDIPTVGEKIGLFDFVNYTGVTEYAYIEETGGDKSFQFEFIDLDYTNVYDEFYQTMESYLDNYKKYQDDLVNEQSFALLNNLVLFENGKNNDPFILQENYSDFALTAKQKNYYLLGIDYGLKADQTKKYKQDVKLNLYPYEGLYKLTTGANGVKWKGVPYETETFKYVSIPKPIDGISIIENLKTYKDSFGEHIKNEVFSGIRSDQTVSKIFDTLGIKYRKAVKDYFISKLEAKYNEIIATYITSIEDKTNREYKEILFGIDTINVPLSGVDGTFSNTTTEYFEVVPDEYTLPVLENYFSYEPYYEYKMDLSTTNEGEVLTTDAVQALPDTLERGAFNYLEDQIGYDATATHKLPQFKFNTQNWVDGNLQTDATGGTLNNVSSDYIMTNSFEKINYEFFDFGNKTLNLLYRDETPLVDYTAGFDFNTVNITMKKGLESFTQTPTLFTNKTQIELLLGIDSYKELVLREKDGSSSYKNSLIKNINEAFKFKFKVSENFYLRKKSEESGLVSDLTNYKTDIILLEEMVFFSMYDDIKNTVKNDLQNVFNNLRISSSQSNSNIEKNINTFLNNIEKSIQKFCKGVNKHLKDIKTQNQTALSTYEDTRDVSTFAISNIDENDYKLKMKKTTWISPRQKDVLETYQKIKIKYDELKTKE